VRTYHSDNLGRKRASIYRAVRPRVRSQIPEENPHAAESDHSKEVFNVILPTGDQTAKVVQPGKEPFHPPAFPIAPKWATILRSLAAVSTVRGNHLDAILPRQIAVQSVAVVRFVAN